MGKYLALVVGKSKTIRAKLSNQLHDFNFEVYSLSSAEEALGYLCFNTPTIVFFDYHLEGMDGLSATTAIKSNPDTAEIPIVLFSPETEDILVSEAQALKGFRSLTIEELKHSNLHLLLQENGILNVNKDDNPSGLNQLFIQKEVEKNIKQQVSSLLELHISEVRKQISEQTSQITKLVNEEIDEIKDAQAHESTTSTSIPLDTLSKEVEAKASRMGAISNAMLILILIALGTIAFQQSELQQSINDLEDSYAVLSELNAQGNALLDDAVSQIAEVMPTKNEGNSAQDSLSIINWSINNDLRYGFNEEPLNEKVVLNIQNLLLQLELNDFEGLVEIDIKHGDYCLTGDETKGWSIAPSQTKLSDCTFASSLIDNTERNYLSVPYVQLEQTTPSVKEGQIELLVGASGFNSPSAPYPAKTNNLSAGDWNQIAAKNNRVMLILE